MGATVHVLPMQTFGIAEAAHMQLLIHSVVILMKMQMQPKCKRVTRMVHCAPACEGPAPQHFSFPTSGMAI